MKAFNRKGRSNAKNFTEGPYVNVFVGCLILGTKSQDVPTISPLIFTAHF